MRKNPFLKNKFFDKIKNDWWFFSMLGLLLIFISFLIVDLVLIIAFPSFFEYANITSATERLGIYYAYFTTQTNYLVVIYLFFILIIGKVQDKHQLNINLFLTVTVYITITMLVFWTGIIGNFIKEGLNDYWHHAYSWVKTVIFHFVIPITMIILYIFTAGWQKIDMNNYKKSFLWLVLIYPLLYFIAIMIRGTLRYNEGKGKTSFPYFFLDFHNYGYFVLIIAVLLIFALTIGLQFFYIWINNARYQTKLKKYQKITKK